MKVVIKCNITCYFFITHDKYLLLLVPRRPAKSALCLIYIPRSVNQCSKIMVTLVYVTLLFEITYSLL